MLVSLITPTHDATHLIALANTIANQTDLADEWVVLPNGKINRHTLAAAVAIVENAGTRVHLMNLVKPGNIGALKRLAFSVASGDVLVEVDHDDLLRSDLVARVRQKAEDGAEFIWSDCVEFNENDWASKTYSEAYGWRYRDGEFDGQPATVYVSFPFELPWASVITHMPNHVRAWTREAYERVGGHRQDLWCGDDYDMMAKSITNGLVLGHIPEPLYAYRRSATQTVAAQNARLRQTIEPLEDDYRVSLWWKWSTDMDLAMLDLGGARRPHSGFQSVDIEQPCDIVANLEEAWPWADSSVGIVRAMDLVEHLHDPLHTMKEAWRVLADGGLLAIEVPSTDGRGAFMDPTHVSFWNELSFLYWTDENMRLFLPQSAQHVAFMPLRVMTYFPSAWHETNNIPYVRAHLVASKTPAHARSIKWPMPHADARPATD